MTPEGEVKKDIKAVLDAMPRTFFCMPVAGMMSKYGISDFIGLHDGWFFAIEAKATSREQPTLAQKIFLASVRRAGGLALVTHADNVHELPNRIYAHARRNP